MQSATTCALKYNSSSISSIGFPLFYFFMNGLRDSMDRYARDNSQNLIKIPTNIYGEQNTPTTNSSERYWRTHIGSSSTWNLNAL